MQRRERSNRRLALALAGAANYYCLLLPEKNSFGDFEKVFVLPFLPLGFPENN